MAKNVDINGAPHYLKCNNQPRRLWAYSNIPADKRDDFDYVTEDERHDDSARFFEYRGSWYDLHDGFVVASDAIKALGFDGIQGESYFSAVVVRYFDRDGDLIDDGDSIVVGYIHW